MSYLHRARFRLADLTRATLAQADLSMADFRDVIGLSLYRLRGAASLYGASLESRLQQRIGREYPQLPEKLEKEDLAVPARPREEPPIETLER